jgi:hypothetical protein
MLKRRVKSPAKWGAARNPGKPVILIAAKNLAGIAEVLRCAQNDRITKENCRTG